MQDTTNQDTTQSSEEAANNNVGELAATPIESERAPSTVEVDVAALETELADTKDRLLRALA